MRTGKSRLHARDEQGSCGGLKDRRQQVRAEFYVNMPGLTGKRNCNWAYKEISTDSSKAVNEESQQSLFTKLF